LPLPVLLRAAGVTAGLSIAGALTGATAALVAAFAVCLALFGWPTEAPDPFLFGLFAAMGAGPGAVLGPALGWGAMRHVPVGRGLAGALFGASVGALVGLVVGLGQPYAAVAGAAAGGVAVGRWLERRALARLGPLPAPPNAASQPTGTPDECSSPCVSITGVPSRAVTARS
jgi:hypothetical protein